MSQDNFVFTPVQREQTQQHPSPSARSNMSLALLKVFVPTIYVSQLLGIGYAVRHPNCFVNCLDCGSNGLCNNCSAGFYGVRCDACSHLCKHSLCLFDFCSEGCIPGRYGYSCTKNCSYCPNECDQWNGACTDPLSHSQIYPNPANQESMGAGYQFMISIIAVTAFIMFLTVAVFVQHRRHPYKKVSVSRVHRHAQKPRRSATQETSPDIVIWETDSNGSACQAVSNSTSICYSESNPCISQIASESGAYTPLPMPVPDNPNFENVPLMQSHVGRPTIQTGFHLQVDNSYRFTSPVLVK